MQVMPSASAQPAGDFGRTPGPRPPATAIVRQARGASLGRVRYDRAGTLVTDDVIVCADGRRYAIGQLRCLAQIVGPVRREVRTAMTVVAILTGSCVLISAVAHSTSLILVVIAALMISAVVAKLSVALWPRRLDLIAFRDDECVALFSSADRQEMGFVVRAVKRSMELHNVFDSR